MSRDSVVSTKSFSKVYLHYIICFIIIFGFGYLPAPAPLTPQGMAIIGVFLGAVYGWTFTDMLIPSIMGIVGMAFLEGTNINQVVAGGFGSQVVWFMILFMVFTNIIEEIGLTQYMANWIMSRKVLSGRPWLLSFAFLIAAYFLGAINVFATMFILWGILYSICQTVGYKPYDPYPTIMIIGITLYGVLGLVLLPFAANALMILTAFEKMTGTVVAFAPYVAFMMPLVLLTTPVFIGIARFIFRIDVSKLKQIDASQLGSGAKLNLTQKIVCVTLVVMIVLLLAPGIFPKSWALTQIISKMGLVGTAIVLMVPLMIIRIDGLPILSFERMIARGLPWGAVFVTALVLPLSAMLTAPNTGVNEAFIQMTAPLQGLPPFVFLLIIFFATTMVTNVANNTATAIVVMPLILTYGSKAGIPAEALVVLLIACTHLAIITAAACPMSGTMFGNTGWIRGKDVYKYAPPIVIGCFTILFFVGYFWGQILF